MKTEYKQEAIDLIYDAIEQHGLIETVYRIFGKKVQIRIPFSRLSCDSDIDVLDLSVRSYNCLRRTNTNTIGQLVDVAQSGDLLQLRNLGIKSCREIQTKLLVYAYTSAPVAWRKEFISALIDQNEKR